MVEGASVKWAIPEKIKQQGLNTYFVNHRPAPPRPAPPILPPPPPGIFRFFTLTLEIPDKTNIRT